MFKRPKMPLLSLFSHSFNFNLKVKSRHHTVRGCRLAPKGQAQFGHSYWELRGRILTPHQNGISVSLPQKVSAQEKCTLQVFPAQRFRHFRKAEEQKITEVHLLFRGIKKWRRICQVSIARDIKTELTDHCGWIKDWFYSSQLHLNLELILNTLGQHKSNTKTL